MSDLFAGLSMAPSTSPSKTNGAPPPPEAPGAAVNVEGSNTDHETEKDHESTPPSPQLESSAAEWVPSAPVTDKFLGRLGTPPSSPGGAAVSSMPPATQIARTNSEDEAKEVLTKAFSMESNVSASASTPNKATAKAAAGSPKPPQSPSNKKRGVGVVSSDTPIPDADVALRLFRQFASKTRPMVPESHGGTQRLSFFGFLFGSSQEFDRKFDAYRDLMEWIVEANDAADDPATNNTKEQHDDNEVQEQDENTNKKKKKKEEQQQDENDQENDKVVAAVLGQSGDTMAKAKKAVASFCHLLSVWGHASAHMAEAEAKGAQYQTFCDILAIGLDTATALVTHGCLDGVQIGMGPTSTATSTATTDKNRSSSSSSTNNNNNSNYLKAVDILAESVFASDLSQERNERAACKFLLSTGVRVTPDGHAMLRGTHLLQTIRVLYHVYLTTQTKSNKTTARASLQQLVTSVFIRMSAASTKDIVHKNYDDNDDDDENNDDDENEHDDNNDESSGFPTDDHRDAFLVLRSLCKLSMRSPPSHMHSHVGLQAGGSSIAWDAKDSSTATPKSPRPGDEIATTPTLNEQKHEMPSLVYTKAIHPALESKILALDLLLYVLQNTKMKGTSFLLYCGPQFHYAIRNYLCVSLLKNCTSDDTRVVNLSLRVFVPIVQNFRSLLKTEIEAFVTNVFFVILDSKNSPMDHKTLVVTLFQEICSDPQTLAEIFLNYDCDLSAVDLFHRIVNTLAKVARSMDTEDTQSSSTISLVAGAGAARMEKMRNFHRELRLDAMRALRQVLVSLHASIVQPMVPNNNSYSEGEEARNESKEEDDNKNNTTTKAEAKADSATTEPGKQSLVQIYDSKKKRRAEESEVVLRFNQKPSAGISYAGNCGHLDGTDPTDVARWLLAHKDKLEKTQIGEYLGREAEYQKGFALKTLHAYVTIMDFSNLSFDDAIRYYLSGFRLPGEAQKIDRIMEKFAERYTVQNPEVFPTADVAFILAFSIIMLNTDLHNPAIKEDRRMTKDGFVRNNRGICDGQDLPRELLTDIFDRIQENPISLKEDDDARERVGDPKAVATSLPTALSPAAFFASPYEEMDRTKETNFNKERDQIVRTTESLLRRRRHASVEHGKSPRKPRSNNHASRPHPVRYVPIEDSGLRDEYVSPMFEVTWGAALAAFSTAMESANGTVGALLAIATDEELESAAINAAETIEVCLTGFRFAICTAGLCGNDVARDAFMGALARFSQLGTGILLEPRHVRCIQTILSIARSDGELLGSSWEHVFKSLSEVNRFHQLFQLMARNDRVIAHAAERRRARLEERERRQKEWEERKAAKDASDSLDDTSVNSTGAYSDAELSYGDDSYLFSDSENYDFNEDMDNKEIDEANARTVYEAVSEGLIEAIYERSSSLSTVAVKEFVLQLCRVSRMEISHYGGQVGSNANQVDLTQVHYRQHHTLLSNIPSKEMDGLHHHQPNIYNLQKLVEVTHYNMDSRPRLVFADLWTTVAAHLTSTALHSNPAVAMYAVDSFRQLGIQYLQREELGVFEFQRRFLKPLEIVMSRSEAKTTKEHLLKCVERLILMFGSPDGERNKRGMLRSGWRPILNVLGLAGRDPDEEIANLGFNMLTAQLEPCLSHEKRENGEEKPVPGVLLAERFVDLVDALLIYVAGPHEDMSLKCIDHLLTLSAFLADDSFALPLLKKRPGNSFDMEDGDTEDDATANNEVLELWWPILLGISKAIGDDRKMVRMKSLAVLLDIITTHFFPSADEDEAKNASRLQTMQLVYRGILTPVREFAEIDALDARSPGLPDDLDRFMTAPKSGETKAPIKSKYYWLDTTFDQFMDACISICLSSIDAFGEDVLVEEIFAMLNSCLLSDSGSLAVRGLRRLEQFVTSDLKSNVVTDDTWATVSHMLRRCLALRGLPRSSTPSSSNGSSGSSKPEDGAADGASNPALEEKEAIREFVMEDNMLADRRFVGSNAVSVIGIFLGGERFAKTFGLRWRLFLVSGLGKAIRDWEYAASILSAHGGKAKARGHNP
jgi:Sec7-like guanine-nucleotide exchange factor